MASLLNVRQQEPKLAVGPRAGMGGLLLDMKGDLVLDATRRMRPDKVDDTFFLDGDDKSPSSASIPWPWTGVFGWDLATDILPSHFHHEFSRQRGCCHRVPHKRTGACLARYRWHDPPGPATFFA
jgi:hypothetical protein